MPTAAPTSPDSVLVVDDDPEIRQLLRQYLKACELRPLLAAGGAEMRHDDRVLVPLSTSEYRLLCIFLMHPRVVLSRERLVELAHKRDLQPSDRTIDFQVYRLRQRLRDAGEGQFLKTIRNSGYVLDADVHAVPPDA